MVSPHKRPVITGKPGIRLALSSFGFSQSPLPALCRQASSCAWRSRLRKIPDRRSTKAMAGGHLRRAEAAQTVISPSRSRILGRPWLPRRQAATQEAQRNPTPARAKRYAQCDLGDKCAPNHTNHCILVRIEATCENESPNGARQTLHTHSHFGHKALQNEPPRRPAQRTTDTCLNTPAEPANETI